MAGLEDLYREIILDHYRSPRNRGELPTPPAVRAEGHNPLCGDEITVFLDVDHSDGNAVVRDLKVSGQGCSISQSSASMMSQAVIGKTVPEVLAVVKRFKGMMSIDTADGVDGDNPAHAIPEATADDPHPLGDLEALQGVVKFPVRIKCATLAWNTLLQALEQ
jgi:nitrogen fixation protein NifU and related proteins